MRMSILNIATTEQMEYIMFSFFVYTKSAKQELNKIAARWPAKAVAQFFTFSKKGSDRIGPR